MAAPVCVPTNSTVVIHFSRPAVLVIICPSKLFPPFSHLFPTVGGWSLETCINDLSCSMPSDWAQPVEKLGRLSEDTRTVRLGYYLPVPFLQSRGDGCLLSQRPEPLFSVPPLQLQLPNSASLSPGLVMTFCCCQDVSTSSLVRKALHASL